MRLWGAALHCVEGLPIPPTMSLPPVGRDERDFPVKPKQLQADSTAPFESSHRRPPGELRFHPSNKLRTVAVYKFQIPISRSSHCFSFSWCPEADHSRNHALPRHANVLANTGFGLVQTLSRDYGSPMLVCN